MGTLWNLTRFTCIVSAATAFLAGAAFSPLVSGAENEAPALAFVEVAADESGLTHEVKIRTAEEPVSAGLSYTWMSPLVDIDGDGNLDLMYYGHHGGGAAVWLGKGDGTFVFDESGYQSRWVFGGRDPIWCDFTGDGRIDGIGTEGQGILGRLFVNDGTGHWEKCEAQIPGRFVDLDADGRHDEVFAGGGTGYTLDPEPHAWGGAAPEKLTATAVFKAEDVVGWPEGVDKNPHPLAANFRDAYSVDLDGDFKNELILCFSGTLWAEGGPGLRSWVLQMKDGSWKDTTAERGLPTGTEHWYLPEDVDVDGDLDLVDLGTGEIQVNDGKGRFTAGGRVFDPETRRGGGVWSGDGEIDVIDLDNNGFRDIVISADHTTENGVFLNAGGGVFVEVGGIPGNRRARKFADVDGDLDIDMVSAREKPVHMIFHRNETAGGAVRLKIVPREPALAPLGCTVWVFRAEGSEDAGRLVHYRQCFVENKFSRSTVIDAVLHVGLGSVDKVDVRVRFPSGATSEVKGVEAGTEATISESP